MKAKLLGLGHAVGSKKISNNYFVDELKLDTSDSWIQERTGIDTRYIADKNTATSDIAVQAAEQCIKNAAIDKTEIDLIILATATPDYLGFPSTACIIQHKLGLNTIGAFDLTAACSGFCYALATASSFIETGLYTNILVIGADCLSSITNYEDRSTCILFADGAGAALVGKQTDTSSGILYSKLYADGSEAETLLIPEGGSKHPLNKNVIENKKHFITMDGKAVFKLAINKIIPAIREGLESLNLNTEAITYLICHQANKRILDNIASQLNLPKEKCYINVNRFGNTSAASIPLALSELHETSPLKKGDIIVLAGFGAGFTWGVNIIKWS